MKFIILFSYLTIGFLSFTQTIDIPKTDYPYHDIIEWKGLGAILMSKDPTGNNKQINLTLVGNSPNSIWDQRFTPKNEDFYYISSENARYVYFLHNLVPEENGKVYFAQLNEAGNVKSTSISVQSAIQKLGDFNVSELELKNIVVTDKALVYHFRHANKKDKFYTDLAVFMTHHNMLVYADILGKTSFDHVKNGNASHWRYIGFTDDKICFATNEVKPKIKGWTVKSFTSKGKLIESQFINAPEEKSVSVENIGFGTTGSYYVHTENDLQSNLLTFHNSTYYLSSIVEKNFNYTLNLSTLENAEWKSITEHKLHSGEIKKTIELGLYPLNEGIGYHIKFNDVDYTVALLNNKGESIVNQFTTKTIYNPSRVLVAVKKELFAVNLPGGTLFFNLEQLKNDGDMKFEFEAK